MILKLCESLLKFKIFAFKGILRLINVSNASVCENFFINSLLGIYSYLKSEIIHSSEIFVLLILKLN